MNINNLTIILVTIDSIENISNSKLLHFVDETYCYNFQTKIHGYPKILVNLKLNH
jgi:hypothetical protein